MVSSTHLTALFFQPRPGDPPEEFLRYAARRGDAPELERLLDSGADPLAPTALGEVALHLAARGGQTRCVEILSPWGGQRIVSDRNVMGGVETPAMAAASAGKLDCLRLLAPQSDLSASNHGGHDALALACLGGHLDCVGFLLDCGQDPNRIHLCGTTCLSLATAQESTDLLAFLLTRCDPNLLDHEGESALMLALRLGLARHCALLAPASDLSIKNPQGQDAFAVCEAFSPQESKSALMALLRSAEEERQLRQTSAPASKSVPKRM